MISLELKKAYNNLDTTEKRNTLSDELIVIGELLKNIEMNHGLTPNFHIKNYEKNSAMNEDEFLSFIYEDVFEIQKQLILIASSLDTNNIEN